MATKDDPEDDILIAEIQKGGPNTEAAWSELVSRYYGWTLNRVMRKGVDRDTAEDIVQDIWLAVSRTIAGFRRESHLATWLSRILENKWHDCIRSRFRRGGLVDESPSDFPTDSENPEQGAIRRQTEELILEVLHQESSVHRMMWMQRQHALEYEEIARQHAKSVATIRSVVSRINTKIKERLGRR
jgi:RNA polymerase sigma factor (sigma-70 family)